MSQKDYIIERAAQMFVSQGIKSVRMDDIAQSLGVSKRTLYELFGDKEELLYLCLSWYLNVQHEEIVKVCAKADNNLEAVLIGFFEMTQYSETNNRIMTNLRKFYPTVFDRIHSCSGDGGTLRLKTSIQKCVNDGYLDGNFNIDLAITLLYYTAVGVIVRKDIVFPEGVSVREAFVQVVICFFRGIATEKGLRVIDDFYRSDRLKNMDGNENKHK